MTSIANEGYDSVFQGQVEALANENDILIGISTSGASNNVFNALKLASQLKCKTIRFSGQNGRLTNEICDVNLAIPSEDTSRIQEMRALIGLIICQLIDFEFKA